MPKNPRPAGYKGKLKRPNGRNCCLYIYRNALGQDRSKTLGPASMDDVTAWAKVTEQGYHLLASKPDPSNTTFGHIMAVWLAYGRTQTGKPRSHTTKNTDKRNCRIHLSHWSKRIAIEIQPDEIQEWINQQSIGMQAKLCWTMSSIYQHAQKYGHIPRTHEANPMNWVSASEETGFEAVAPDAKQCKAILDQIDEPLVRCLVILVAVTGVRIGEALGLKWSDIDWLRGRIHIRRDWADGEFGEPKSKASKAPVEMHRQLATVMMEWRKVTMYAKDGDFVFASEKMKGEQPRTGSGLSSDYIRPAAIKAGVIDDSCPRFGAHNMRHGLASWLADAGTEVAVIQRMLRWASPRMLQRYVHPKKTKKAQGGFLRELKPGGVQRGVQ